MSVAIDQGIARSAGERVVPVCATPTTPRASVLCLPALGVPASYYRSFAEGLAGWGAATVVVDHRGHGASSVRIGRGVDFGYRTLIDDAELAIEAVRSAHPKLPIYVVGHSLGGHVAALLAARGARMDGLVLVASGTPYGRCFPWPRSWLIRFGVWAIPRVSALVGYYPGRWFGFGGTEARQLMTEWARLAGSGRFVVDGTDLEEALTQVRLPILAISLDGDWMAPAPAVDHLVAKMTRAKTRRIHESADTMAARALDHFRWARHPAGIVERIGSWIESGEGSSGQQVDKMEVT